MNQPPRRNPDLTVARIDQPRGDGLGRALVVESKSWQVSVLLDEPGDVQELIERERFRKGLQGPCGPPARRPEPQA